MSKRLGGVEKNHDHHPHKTAKRLEARRVMIAAKKPSRKAPRKNPKPGRQKLRG